MSGGFGTLACCDTITIHFGDHLDRSTIIRLVKFVIHFDRVICAAIHLTCLCLEDEHVKVNKR